MIALGSVVLAATLLAAPSLPPTVGVSVVQHGRVVMAQNENAVFPLMSISKQFAAVEVLRLVERKKLALDDPVRKYIDIDTTATIRQLLNHTSGIRSYTDMPEYDALSSRPYDVMASIRNARPDFPPGRRWHYDNSGYYLLGRVVERVTGKRYWDVLRDDVWKTAGLRSTLPCVDAHIAAPQAWENVFAPGAVCSTAADLTRWEAALDDGRLLSPAMLKLARTPTQPAEGPRIDYGFAMRLGTIDGIPVVGHTGGGNGFRTALEHVPSADLTIVILARESDGVTPSLEAARMVRKLLHLPPFAMHDRPVPPEEARAAAGRWETDHGPVVVFEQAGKLRWKPVEDNGEGHPMSYEGDHRFAVGEDDYIEIAGNWAVRYQGGLFGSNWHR